MKKDLSNGVGCVEKDHMKVFVWVVCISEILTLEPFKALIEILYQIIYSMIPVCLNRDQEEGLNLLTFTASHHQRLNALERLKLSVYFGRQPR